MKLSSLLLVLSGILLNSAVIRADITSATLELMSTNSPDVGSALECGAMQRVRLTLTVDEDIPVDGGPFVVTGLTESGSNDWNVGVNGTESDFSDATQIQVIPNN